MPLGNLWGFTSSGKKIRIGGVSYVPTSLLISGDWENPQYVGSPVDYTGLTFTVTSTEGITETVIPTSVSPSVWSDIGTQTATFTYIEASGSITATKSASVLYGILSSISITTPPTKVTYNQGDTFDSSGAVVTALWDNGDTTNVTSSTSWSPTILSTVGTQIITASYAYNGVTKTTTTTVTVNKIPSSLTVGGSWSNVQFINESVDTTGLTFICTYSDGSTDSITPSSVSPLTWGSTVGTQTATFTYTESGVTVSATKSASVVRKLTSLTIGGSWSNAQHEGQAPDTTGLTFTANYNNGTTATVIPTVSPSVWASNSGNQTATFSYTENGVSVSNTKSANMTYTYTTASSGHGSVSGSGIYVYSESSSQTKSISYTPNTGYQFSQWSTSGGSECSASGSTLTINAGCHGNITATASFSAIVYTITMNTNNSTYGTTSINTATYTISNSEQTRTVTATVENSNIYQFNSWSADKGSISGNTLTIPAGTYGNFTVTGNFGLKTFNITVQSADTSKGTVTGSTTYQYSSSAQTKTVTNTPASGYELDSWSITGPTSGSASVSENTLTISAGAYGNVNITATFKNKIKEITDSWETIASRAAAGTASQYYSVGDWKNVSVASGKIDSASIAAGTYRAVIIGINHNSTWEDKNSIDFCIGQSTGGTEICFGDGDIRIGTSSNGWTGTDMYTVYLPAFYNLLSGNVGLQDAMIAPKKYTHNYSPGSSNNNEEYVTLSRDSSRKLFLMSEYEIFGLRTYANSYEQNKQAQYDYYSTSGLAKPKQRRSVVNTSNNAYWWTRSASCRSNTNEWCHITYTGTLDDYSPSTELAIAPCFRVGAHPVGGIIYYIDNTADGTYQFYDANGDSVSAPTVGTDCTDWSYTVSGATKDKYYVYNPSAMFKRDRTGTWQKPYIAWTYLDTTNQSYIDNADYRSGLPSGKKEWEYYGYKGRVYETLDGTYTGTAIGTGKSNTMNMLGISRVGGRSYSQNRNTIYKDGSGYSETIWYICDRFNKGTYSLNGRSVINNTGCSDWYIPSKDELETMKNAIGASTFASMLYSGDISSNLVSLWSSSAYSDVFASWLWLWNRGYDRGMDSYFRWNGAADYCLALSRSF